MLTLTSSQGQIALLDSQPFAPSPTSANAHGGTLDGKLPVSVHPFLLDMRIPSTERLSAQQTGTAFSAERLIQVLTQVEETGREQER